MKAQAAIDRAAQAVAPRPIDRVLPEHAQQHEAQHDARDLAEFTETECDDEQPGIERQQDRDRDQEAEQQLARSPDIFETLAGELGAGPQMAADIGGEPEPVDAEREHQPDGAVDEQPPEGPGAVAETHRRARGRNDAGLRRGYGRVDRGHAGLF